MRASSLWNGAAAQNLCKPFFFFGKKKKKAKHEDS